MADAPTDPDGPPLRTFVWLRRIALASALAGVGLLALRQATLRVAAARWQAPLEAIVAAGVPARVEYWQPPPIPDDANPAAFYRRAFPLISKTVDSPSMSHYSNIATELGDAPPYTPLWHQLADAAEAADAPALVLARQARAADPANADWGTIYRPPVLSILLPHLNDARNLANLLSDCGENAILRGDVAEGVERFRDTLHLSRSLQVRRPVLVETLVAGGIAALACDRIGTHALALPIGDAPGKATPAQLRALIDELLATADALGSGSTYPIEAALTREAVGAVAAEAGVLRGVLLLERPSLAADWLAAAAIARTPDHRGRDAMPNPRAATTAPAILSERMAKQRLSRPLRDSSLAGAPRHALVGESRIVTMLRAAAIVLAARLHAHEHGRPPRSFDDLVPEFLARRPDNPLVGDGTPFRIRVMPGGLPGGGDRVLLDVVSTSREPANVGRVGWPITAVDLAPWPTTPTPTRPD